MHSPQWICKKNEIACHVRKMFLHYGESMDYFDEYLISVLEYDIDRALECFRSLVKYVPVELKKKKETYVQGMCYQAPFVAWASKV